MTSSHLNIETNEQIWTFRKGLAKGAFLYLVFYLIYLLFEVLKFVFGIFNSTALNSHLLLTFFLLLPNILLVGYSSRFIYKKKTHYAFGLSILGIVPLLVFLVVKLVQHYLF